MQCVGKWEGLKLSLTLTYCDYWKCTDYLFRAAGISFTAR